MTASAEKSVTVTLSGDEALVLYDWLARTEGVVARSPDRNVGLRATRRIYIYRGALSPTLRTALRLKDHKDQGVGPLRALHRP